MNKRDLLSLAWRNLSRRKSRTILTILSVVIGAVSIIVMLSLGFGLKKSFEESFASLGSMTNIEVTPTNYFDPSMESAPPTQGVLNDEAIRKLEQLDHVKFVLPSRRVSGQFKTKDKEIEFWAEMYAIDAKYLEEDNMEISQGRALKNTDKMGFLMGNKIRPMKMIKRGGGMYDVEIVEDFDWNRAKFFIQLGYEDPQAMMDVFSGKTSEQVPIKMIGQFTKSDFLQDRAIYMTEETANILQEKDIKLQQNMAGPDAEVTPVKKPLKKNKVKYYDQALVKVDDPKNVQALTDTINNELNLSAYSEQEFINQQQEQFKVVQYVLGGIGSVALFVAAIGIANTMLMSIQERIKEIGVMKVIGAQVSDIRALFLTESSMISLFGGILGIIFSYLISSALNGLYQSQIDPSMMGDGFQGISYIPLYLPIVSMLFSIFIGLVAGYFPAKKATKLSAIDAIRTN